MIIRTSWIYFIVCNIRLISHNILIGKVFAKTKQHPDKHKTYTKACTRIKNQLNVLTCFVKLDPSKYLVKCLAES